MLAAMTVPEVPLRETRHGLVADGDGWFVINARESRWRDAGHFGRYCNFEGKRPFRQLGMNVNILQPGQPIGLYHRERAQEDFLVLAGRVPPARRGPRSGRSVPGTSSTARAGPIT